MPANTTPQITGDDEVGSVGAGCKAAALRAHQPAASCGGRPLRTALLPHSGPPSDARPTSSCPQALIGEGSISAGSGLAHGRKLHGLIEDTITLVVNLDFLLNILGLSSGQLDILKTLTGVLSVVGDLLTINSNLNVTGSTSLTSVTVGNLAQIQLLNVAGESNLGKVGGYRQGARQAMQGALDVHCIPTSQQLQPPSPCYCRQ